MTWSWQIWHVFYSCWNFFLRYWQILYILYLFMAVLWLFLMESVKLEPISPFHWVYTADSNTEESHPYTHIQNTLQILNGERRTVEGQVRWRIIITVSITSWESWVRVSSSSWCPSCVHGATRRIETQIIRSWRQRWSQVCHVSPCSALGDVQMYTETGINLGWDASSEAHY